MSVRTLIHLIYFPFGAENNHPHLHRNAKKKLVFYCDRVCVNGPTGNRYPFHVGLVVALSMGPVPPRRSYSTSTSNT